MSNTANTLYETGTAYNSRAPVFTSDVGGVRVNNLFSFLCCFSLVIVLCLVSNVADGILVPDDIICQVISIVGLTWFVRYIH